MFRVDGLHQIDVDNYIAQFPYSSIAQLAATGVKYTNDFLPPPSDSFPAVATFVTGTCHLRHLPLLQTLIECFQWCQLPSTVSAIASRA